MEAFLTAANCSRDGDIKAILLLTIPILPLSAYSAALTITKKTAQPRKQRTQEIAYHDFYSHAIINYDHVVMTHLDFSSSLSLS
jgi:hypothetical protein